MSSIENGRGERPPDTTASVLFADLWEAHVGRVHRYVSRHVDPHMADDVVSETFLVAWRRLDDVPEDALPWLLVVARNTMANSRRSTYRRRAMEIELARVAHLAEQTPTPGSIVPEREHVLAALGRLAPKYREVVLLVAWDGLDASQAAQVLGASPAAVKMRLSRARRQLSRELEDQAEPATDSPRRASGALAPHPATTFNTADLRSRS
ncbi:RNA polymerase sigma factor [Oerskovia enterophila]|uniref:RNA polymerase sigma factor n=1 Tax=Oerskovia enterophila TaxID=43678 RepID=UPI0037F1429E